MKYCETLSSRHRWTSRMAFPRGMFSLFPISGEDGANVQPVSIQEQSLHRCDDGVYFRPRLDLWGLICLTFDCYCFGTIARPQEGTRVWKMESTSNERTISSISSRTVCLPLFGGLCWMTDHFSTWLLALFE